MLTIFGGQKAYLVLLTVSYTHLDVYKRQVLIIILSSLVLGMFSQESTKPILLRSSLSLQLINTISRIRFKNNNNFKLQLKYKFVIKTKLNPLMRTHTVRAVSYTHLDVYKRQVLICRHSSEKHQHNH